MKAHLCSNVTAHFLSLFVRWKMYHHTTGSPWIKSGNVVAMVMGVSVFHPWSPKHKHTLWIISFLDEHLLFTHSYQRHTS